MSDHQKIDGPRVVIADGRLEAWAALVAAIHTETDDRRANQAETEQAVEVWYEFDEGPCGSGEAGTHIIHGWPTGETFNSANGFVAYYGQQAGTC